MEKEINIGELWQLWGYPYDNLYLPVVSFVVVCDIFRYEQHHPQVAAWIRGPNLLICATENGLEEIPAWAFNGKSQKIQ